MTGNSKLSVGVLGAAVVLIVLGEVFPVLHADSGTHRISVLGAVIIVLLLAAMGIILAGSRKAQV